MKKILEFIKGMFTWKRMVGSLLLILVVLFIVLSFFQSKQLDDYVSLDRLSNTIDGYVSEQYNSPLYSDYIDGFQQNLSNEIERKVEQEFIDGILVDKNNSEYGKYFDTAEFNEAFLLNNENDVEINHNALRDGLFRISLNYMIVDPAIDAVQIDLKINGETPFYESQTLVLPSEWQFETNIFTKDRYNNDIQPRSYRPEVWQSVELKDYKGMYQSNYQFFLRTGDTISLSYINASILVESVSYVTENETPSYEEYISGFQNEKRVEELIQISARDIYTRSDPSIRLRVEQDPSNLYYGTQELKLNTIFGDSWENGGQTVSYQIIANEAGLYNLSFKYRQYLLKDMPSFRRIYINDEVPFSEFNNVSFPHTMSFVNRTLRDKSGNPYIVYLNKGANTIKLEAVTSPYKNSIETLKYIMNGIQNLSLNIKRYTSGGTDRYRDWDISVYFPEAENTIKQWASILDGVYLDLLSVASSDSPSELANLKVSRDRLIDISKNINELPSRMVQFSDGDSSVNQLLGTIVAQLLRSNIELERTMIHGELELPNPYADIFTRIFEGTKRLILSFINNPYSINNSSDDLNIWVNYPRQYIEIMQIMIDQQFDSDRKVTLSQMPDQNKLILANTSGQAPDIALGVDHWIPYEFAIRGAVKNLRKFSGYENLVNQFSPGAMIPYAFEDGIFGIPSTQNFWVTYYRTDIINSIGLDEIPSTWDELISTLPLLQSYGLNYFIPLAQFSGLKPFVATIPYVYQFGGDLYTESGMQTGINSTETIEGMELMSELFTLYNVPKFVGNFFNSFRYGTLPIGIGDLATYILLNAAADELDGLWDMALHPGVYDPISGEVNRAASVGAQSNMILSQSNYPEEAWSFLEWWMSTEVQIEFAFTLLSTYGKQYFWNTANIDAFSQIPMPVQHKEIILEQWKYAIEAPRIPGSYMVEREISNAWTNIVFNGENPRQALDEAVRIANREILYKMSEFDYVVDGISIKDYLVPTLENIYLWLKEDET